jgi:CheY-like chemotaxis protein
MKSILVVEDDPAFREVIIEVLTDAGYAVLQAVDGQAALAVARTEQPDIILMDLMMPKLDGVVATCLLKSDPRTQRSRIIAMSAGSNLRYFVEHLPADSLLSKPFDLDTLLADIALQARQLATAENGDPEPA